MKKVTATVMVKDNSDEEKCNFTKQFKFKSDQVLTNETVADLVQKKITQSKENLTILSVVNFKSEDVPY